MPTRGTGYRREMGASVEPSLDLDLPAVPDSPTQARYAIRAAVAGITLDNAAVDLAVSEAVTNAVIHAYRDRDPAAAPGRVQVTLDVDDHGIWIVVSDRGVGMSPRADSPGLGLGLPLIAKLCQELVIDQRADGTSLRMRFGFTTQAQHADKD